MWFYYRSDQEDPVLLKVYPVSLGRVDAAETSGLLTPMGKYSLGNRVATYAPRMKGTYRGKSTEMMTVFGTRWLPFEKELAPCSRPAKGYGIHGVPWRREGDELIEQEESIGKYASDGCIRLRSHDIEELYSIVISRPTTVELVRDFFDSTIHRGKNEFK
jgi:lipoprotein-anchoring transpeptidase ErfK/SrfK